MIATIECRCGKRIEAEVESRVAAEVLAERHESGFVRRTYRHATTITYAYGAGGAHAARARHAVWGARWGASRRAA